MEIFNEQLEKENNKNKKLEKTIFYLEENFKQKIKELDNEIFLRKEISQKNEMLIIEIEELNLLNSH